MTRPGQNAAAAHVVAMIARHGGHWRPHLIDADFYDTRRAVALIQRREFSRMYRAVVGVLLLIIVLLLLGLANG